MDLAFLCRQGVDIVMEEFRLFGYCVGMVEGVDGSPWGRWYGSREKRFAGKR